MAAYANRGRTGLLGAPTYPMLRDATLPTLYSVLEQHEIPYKMAKSSMVITFPEADNAKLLCRAVENFDRLRGTNLAWFGLDETSFCPEQAWQQLEARLRDPLGKQLNGFGAWTPFGHNWIYKRFIKSPLPGYSAVLANPMENTYLPSDFYPNLMNSYSNEFAQQEVLGKYLNVFSGRVYSSFSSEDNGNVWRPEGDNFGGFVPCHYDANRPVLWALDFNVSPATSVIAQTVPQRKGISLGATISGRSDNDKPYIQLNVLDEIFLTNVSTYQHVEAFWKKIEHKLPPYPYRLHVIVYGDASGKSRHSSSSQSDYQIISEFFERRKDKVVFEMRVPSDNPAVMDRINSVNAMCQTYTLNRRLCVHERCKELIQDLDEVSYAKDADDNLLPSLSTKNKLRTHVSDALGYLIFEEFGIRSFAGEVAASIL